MRVVVAEPAGEPGVHRLSDFVAAAAIMASGEVAEIVTPDQAGDGKVDAAVWDGRLQSDDPAAFARAGIPVTTVAISDGPPGPATRVSLHITGMPRADHMRVSPTKFNESAGQIAKWLGKHVRVEVTLEERNMLEVVAKAARDAAESRASAFDEPDDAAQALGAAETIETQLRTPRPSRKALSWAVGQLAQVPVGLITGVASTYLFELVNHFAS